MNKETGLKLRSNRNSVLGCIPEEEKDRVLGFLIKRTSLITRKYQAFIATEKFQKCPYCNESEGNVILHQFKCYQLYRDSYADLGDPLRKLEWKDHDNMMMSL